MARRARKRLRRADDGSDTESESEVKPAVIEVAGYSSSGESDESDSDAGRAKKVPQEDSESSESDDAQEKEDEMRPDGGMGVEISDDEDGEGNWEAKKKDIASDSDTEDEAESQPTGASRLRSLTSAESVVAESEDESDGTEEEKATIGEFQEAKWLMRRLISHVSVAEGTAIRRGLIPTGPPIEAPIAHADEFARKFRWPQHVRNLRNTEFSQDPNEILEDYELLPKSPQPSDGYPGGTESAFAQVPRPMMTLAAEAVRRLSRKRRRAGQEESKEQLPSPTSLLNVARVGGRFGEKFIGSLLAANGKALQGLEGLEDYDSRCWTSLPMSRKPIANWRFVLEHLRKTVGNSDAQENTAYPPLKQETLTRITNHLKQHYGLAWQQQDEAFFKAIHTLDSPEEHASGDGQSVQHVQL